MTRHRVDSAVVFSCCVICIVMKTYCKIEEQSAHLLMSVAFECQPKFC